MGKLSKKIGFEAEQIAASFLKQNGFFIIEQNFYAKKYGEIDIIAKKGDVLHFIEVKSSFKDFEPIYNITANKLKKIINSANYYIQIKKLFSFTISIDALIIKNNKIEHIENITF